MVRDVLLPPGSRRRALARRALRRAPNPTAGLDQHYLRLAARHRDLADADRLTASLVTHYFSSPDVFPDADGGGKYLDTPGGAADLDSHLTGRLQTARDTVVPWLNAAQPLDGARVLEVGCGTGSSTVALAEQGAVVTAIDVDAGSLAAARDRLHIYGLSADLRLMNAAELTTALDVASYTFVIFYATLEHMTLEERLTCLRSVWDAMSPGSLLMVTETPNRLWYFDHHTSLERFFLWLPDDLAMRYAGRTPRERFNEQFTDPAAHDVERFARWGRGVSYHDFEVALDRQLRDIDVVSFRHDYLARQLPRFRLGRSATDDAFLSALRTIAPDLDEGWLQPDVEVILRR